MSASLQQSSINAPGNLAGLWSLAPRRTISLQPKAHGVLRIAQGRVWVTTGAFQSLSGQADSGDVVMNAGDELAVSAGTHLVMESWPLHLADDVRFDFSEDTAAVVAVAAPRFQREVASPASELLHELQASLGALGRAVWAFARVLRGLAGYGEYLVAGRGRVMSPLEAGQS